MSFFIRPLVAAVGLAPNRPSQPKQPPSLLQRRLLPLTLSFRTISGKLVRSVCKRLLIVSIQKMERR